MDSLAGHFLIASPAIMDPNFERAVVLITAHTDEGAVGVILNRCSQATVGEAVLAEFEDPDEAGVVVLDDVGFVAIEEALEVHAPDLQRTRVFAGVAGWGPEQLEDEFDRDDWIIEPADVDAIFTDDPDKLWSEVLRRKGGRYELVARMP